MTLSKVMDWKWFFGSLVLVGLLSLMGNFLFPLIGGFLFVRK